MEMVEQMDVPKSKEMTHAVDDDVGVNKKRNVVPTWAESSGTVNLTVTPLRRHYSRFCGIFSL